jgi:hypothetical protein
VQGRQPAHRRDQALPERQDDKGEEKKRKTRKNLQLL